MCAYNRTVSKVHDFLKNEAKGSRVIGAESLEDMVSKLKKPRRIILLVKAGQAVDDFIDKLVGRVSSAALKSLVNEPRLPNGVLRVLSFRFLYWRPEISSSMAATLSTEIQQWVLEKPFVTVGAYRREAILTQLWCLCPLAALQESERERAAVCWQRSQWRRRRGALWTLPHARGTKGGLVRVD